MRQIEKIIFFAKVFLRFFEFAACKKFVVIHCELQAVYIYIYIYIYKTSVL